MNLTNEEHKFIQRSLDFGIEHAEAGATIASPNRVDYESFGSDVLTFFLTEHKKEPSLEQVVRKINALIDLNFDSDRIDAILRAVQEADRSVDA